MRLTEITSTHGKAWTSMIATVCAAAALSACGGGVPEEDAKLLGAPLQAHRSEKMTGAASDFNPVIWDQHRWDECDCGRNATPSNAPWTGGR
jgi:hypothetical protein